MVIAEDEFKKRKQGVGSYTVSPQYSWKVLEDRPNKFGLISEITNEKSCMISGKSKGRRVSYASVAQFLFTFPSMEVDYILQIQLMMTYFNAGEVDVYLCDKYLTSVDSLWPDYGVRRASTQESFKTKLLASDWISKCDAKDASKPITGTIELKHKCLQSSKSIRDKEKFKLVKLEIRQSQM